MDELKIVKAEVSIHVLKVGNKSVTKAVLRQIPELRTDQIPLATSCLGYVRDTYDRLVSVWFLVSVGDQLYKIADRQLLRKPAPTYKVEVERYDKDCLTEVEYNDWVASYAIQRKLIKDAIQLYIAT